MTRIEDCRVVNLKNSSVIDLNEVASSVKDAAGRLYFLEGVSCSHTYLVCIKTGDRLTVSNNLYKQMGFQ